MPNQRRLTEYERLSTADLCRVIADVLEVLNERVKDPQERQDITAVMLAGALERGSEPFWMQDVRIAQKRLESARRAASRAVPNQPK